MRFPRKRVALECLTPSLTVQSQKEEADINVIVSRFGVTGVLPQRLDRLNIAAFEGIFDYQTAMNAVVAADRAFLQVPADIRARFSNDPQKFVSFVTDPANLDELRRLKLAPAAPVEPVAPVVAAPAA
ncbi:internal scaffolding protein [robinz microvirus RP_97]|nr:internal scaffolding protein [robinz microvirus RP_97]